MGIDYTATLYFPAARVADALRALAGMAPPAELTTVLLPDGEVLVPFSSDFKHDPVTLAVGGEVRLETALRVPFDDVLRAGGAHYGTEEVGGVEYALFGIVYLRVRLGCLHASLDFTPATSGMSRALVASDALRGRFRELSAAAGGLAGWLDTEDFEYRRLEDPAATFRPEPDPPGMQFGWGSPDATAAAVCRGLGRPLDVVAELARRRTADAVGLARAARAGAARGVLPILADALQDAGCVGPEVLDHLRRAGGHSGACWVAEVLLASAGTDAGLGG